MFQSLWYSFSSYPAHAGRPIRRLSAVNSVFSWELHPVDRVYAIIFSIVATIVIVFVFSLRLKQPFCFNLSPPGQTIPHGGAGERVPMVKAYLESGGSGPLVSTPRARCIIIAIHGSLEQILGHVEASSSSPPALPRPPPGSGPNQGRSIMFGMLFILPLRRR